MLPNPVRVVQSKRPGAFGAGGYNLLGLGGFDTFKIKARQSVKCHYIALPYLVVTTAALVG
ncbi:unnamed protein product [marine sediment metagenome]|uniref:Uncharacterized protein n=1 Tax=marine sediment metagenome TaxID=412755 RepID=X0XAW3_9ZZZZ